MMAAKRFGVLAIDRRAQVREELLVLVRTMLIPCASGIRNDEDNYVFICQLELR
jgi:hypothetical protein